MGQKIARYVPPTKNKLQNNAVAKAAFRSFGLVQSKARSIGKPFTLKSVLRYYIVSSNEQHTALFHYAQASCLSRQCCDLRPGK